MYTMNWGVEPSLEQGTPSRIIPIPHTKCLGTGHTEQTHSHTTYEVPGTGYAQCTLREPITHNSVYYTLSPVDNSQESEMQQDSGRIELLLVGDLSPSSEALPQQLSSSLSLSPVKPVQVSVPDEGHEH